MNATRSTSKDGEAGFAGGFEGLLFGLLLFVVGTLLVANAWGVVATKFALDAAARQAVVTWVQAPDAAQADLAAQAAALDSLSGSGRPASGDTVTLPSVPFARCQRATVRVSARAPFVALPWIGVVGHGETVSATASELVDPLRSGLPGVATCA